MRLYDEYLKRRGITVPVVQHRQEGAVLLWTTDPLISTWQNRWVLVTARWRPDDDHPGKYEVVYHLPVHNGGTKGRLFAQMPPIMLEWDEYEDFFYKWAAGLKGVRPASGHRQVVLTAWEMFVFCYDDWFRRQGSDLKDRHLYTSIDDQLSADARYAGYQSVLLYLSAHHPAVLQAWKYEMLMKVYNYSDWLVDLINASKHDGKVRD